MSTVNADFTHVGERFSRKSARLGLQNISVALRLCTLSAVVAGLMTFGCGTPAAHLVISAPSTAVAGSPFTVTVTAMAGGSRDTIINSPIQFSSSDSAAILPGIYYFNANDAGSHTFTNGATLMTAGSQSITASVIGAPGISGTVNITVTAMTSAAQFKVSAPASGTEGLAFSR